jgi:hypothetical protein
MWQAVQPLFDDVHAGVVVLPSWQITFVQVFAVASYVAAAPACEGSSETAAALRVLCSGVPLPPPL